MLAVTVLIPYCNYLHDTANLRSCLASLAAQTQPAHQIILADDSHLDDRPEVYELCRQYGIEYLAFPFVNYAPAFSRKFNRSIELATGEAICLLCSNWVLGVNWLEEMAKWLEELGLGYIVACDNARHHMQDGAGRDIDWFAGSPDRFEATNWHLVDEGFLTMLYRQDWQNYDEDFDPQEGDMSEQHGAWHAVIEWGYRLLQKQGMRLMIRRDLEATHLQRGNRPAWMTQTQWSDQLLKAKGAG